MINNYFDRFDASKNYDKHLFRAGFVLQSAELNEIQSATQHRIRSIADALFKDGDIVRDARIIVDSNSGQTTCEAGAVYLKGAVRGIEPARLTIATDTLVTVGIYLRQTTTTELEDPALRDPATGTRNYQEPGAARLTVQLVWGYAGDGQEGEFYPIYTVENGVVRAKEPPPQLDSVTQALARYDRDSAGGSYVVNGLNLAAAADLANGKQVYTVSEGRARVNGYAVEFATGQRLIYETAPDLRFIDSEPHTSSGVAPQRIELDRTPVTDITQVRITAEKTVTLTHGGFSGAQDPLPDTAVTVVLEVKQGTTTYLSGSDYKLTAGKIDWSLSGAEPAPGASYTVKYQYITSVSVQALDEGGFTVSGAVAGSQIFVSYNQKLPRIDRLCLDQAGQFVWLGGIAADWNPQPPGVPANLLPIASVYQTWTQQRSVSNDGVRVVAMTELARFNQRLDQHGELIAQQRLQVDANLREAGTKKGMFVDAFLSNDMRDQGSVQNAAIVNGELTLPIDALAVHLPNDIRTPARLAYTLAPVLEQTLRTGTMLINPYQAFDPIPAEVILTPAVDRWSTVDTTWASAITERFTIGNGRVSNTTTSTTSNLLSETRTRDEFLRPISVSFEINGFSPNETLASLSFDGIELTANP